MNKSDVIQETEIKLKQYFDRISEINRLQNRLALFMKNKQAAQQSIVEYDVPERKTADQDYYNLQQEIINLDTEIIRISTTIRERQRDIIDTHYIIEQLTEEDRKLITLVYKECLSLSKIGTMISLSPSGTFERKKRILENVSSML